MTDPLANATVVIVLQHRNISNQHVDFLKLTQHYTSNISQFKKERERLRLFHISDLVVREGLSESVFKVRSQCQKGTGHAQIKRNSISRQRKPFMLRSRIACWRNEEVNDPYNHPPWLKHKHLGRSKILDTNHVDIINPSNIDLSVD